MSNFIIGKSQKSHILIFLGGGGNCPKNVCATLFFYLGLDNFLLCIYKTRLEFIYKSQINKMENHKNHIFHTFLVEYVPKKMCNFFHGNFVF